MCRNTGFLDLELWTDGLELPSGGRLPRELGRLKEDLHATGMNVPCVHLPTRLTDGTTDLSSSDGSTRLATFDAWHRTFDLAVTLGARVAVCHVSAQAGDEIERLVEEANYRGLALAFEAETLPRSSLTDLLGLLRELGTAARMHGICVDLARQPTDPGLFQPLGDRLAWVEVSGSHGDRHHLPPDEAPQDLRPVVESFHQMPFIAYEVVPAGAAEIPPGEAELSILLRRLDAWHRAEGRTRYGPGTSPFLPFG